MRRDEWPMWKKLLMALVTLVGFFMVAYANFYHCINGGFYHAGADFCGRIRNLKSIVCTHLATKNVDNAMKELIASDHQIRNNFWESSISKALSSKFSCHSFIHLKSVINDFLNVNEYFNYCQSIV